LAKSIRILATLLGHYAGSLVKLARTTAEDVRFNVRATVTFRGLVRYSAGSCPQRHPHPHLYVAVLLSVTTGIGAGELNRLT
jgi:hypothetical protein